MKLQEVNPSFYNNFSSAQHPVGKVDCSSGFAHLANEIPLDNSR